MTSPSRPIADYLGLNRTDARCLDIIERLRGVTAGQLARESGLSTGAVTTCSTASSARGSRAAPPTRRTAGGSSSR